MADEKETVATPPTPAPNSEVEALKSISSRNLDSAKEKETSEGGTNKCTTKPALPVLGNVDSSNKNELTCDEKELAEEISVST